MKFPKPNLGDNICITSEVSEAFCKGTLDNLCDYEQLDEQAADILANGKRDVWLPDVYDVSEQVAEILARHEGTLRLDGVDDLKPEIARALAQQKGVLGLLAVTELSDESALALAAHDGPIDFICLERLPAKPGHLALAKTLAATTGQLSLIGLFDLSIEAAELLTQHKGDLMLGLQNVSDELAAILSKHDGKIELPAECEMSAFARNLLKIKPPKH